jgi:hypothetical protein
MLVSRLARAIALVLYGFMTLSAPASAGWWTFFFPVEDAPQRGEEASISGKPAARQLVDQVAALAELSRNGARAVIHREIWSSLPDYMRGCQTLPDAIQRFVRETLEIGVVDVVVERYLNPGDVSEGISGDPLFFVRRRGGGLVAVVKAFAATPDDLQDFALELRALGLLRRLDLRESQQVSVLAVGRLCGEQQQYALMILAAAPGFSVTRHFKNVGSEEKGSRARSDQLGSLRKAVAALGRALAEVHLSGTRGIGQIAPAIWQVNDLWFNRFLACYRDIDSLADIPAELLQERHDFLRLRSRAHRHLLAFVHGDAHTGNYLFDPKSGTLTIIDIGRFCRSMDQNGEPCGQSESDFTAISSFMEVVASYYGLTSDESAEIQRLFESSYHRYPGIQPFCAECLEYNRFLFWTRSIAIYRRRYATYSAEIRQQVQVYIEIAVSEIRRDLEQWLYAVH